MDIFRFLSSHFSRHEVKFALFRPKKFDSPPPLQMCAWPSPVPGRDLLSSPSIPVLVQLPRLQRYSSAEFPVVPPQQWVKPVRTKPWRWPAGSPASHRVVAGSRRASRLSEVFAIFVKFTLWVSLWAGGDTVKRVKHVSRLVPNANMRARFKHAELRTFYQFAPFVTAVSKLFIFFKTVQRFRFIWKKKNQTKNKEINPVRVIGVGVRKSRV